MGKLPEPEGLTGSSAGQMYLQSPRLYYEKLRSLKGEVYKNSALALSLRSNKAKGQLSPYPEAIKMQIAEWRKAMENENDELFGDISQPESTIRVRSKIHSTVKACQDIIMAAFSNVWRLQKSGFIQTQISILVIDSDRTSVANLLSVSVEEVKALAQIFNKAVHFTENPAEPDLESMVGTLTRNCDKLLSCLHLSTRPPETDFIEGYPNDAACFRCWEDTAHLLDLAVLIYTGAHVDPLIEGMINTAKLFGMFSRIILQTQPLKCLSPLFGDRQAWIFSLIPIIPHDGIYISTSADLFADIWGPMWKVYREDDRSILQYNVGGGSIVPWDHDIGHHPRLKDNERLGHWMTLSSTFSRSNTIEGFNPWLPTGKSPEGDRSEVQDSSEREPEDAAEEDHHNSESEPEDAAEADHDSSESEPEDAAEEDHDSSESELNSSATTYTVGGSSLVPWDHDVEHHPRLKDNERLGHWMTLSSTFSGSNTTEGFNPWLRIGKSPEGDQSAPPPEEKKKAIKLKDAVGRIFIFPFHLCNTWRRMEDLIRQVFRHVKFIGTHVAEGHYDLVGPNGEIILPQDWETMIEPDWTITMHMWPMPEPPPKAEEPPPAEPPPPNAPPTTPTPDLAPETIVIVPPEVQDSSETEPEDAGEEHDSSESEPEYAAEEDQASSDILDLNPRLSSRWNSYATAHPFSGRERLLIGAQASPKLVWNRCICSTHRITHQLKEKHRLHFLNTTRLFHYVDGRNLGIVAGGHGLTLGANITIKTQIGRSWKDVLLELWENSPHARHPRTLENFWGVVISFCTFNARRVRLTELLGTDSITNLLKPFRWSDTCLKEEFESAVSSSDPFALRRLWDNEQNWQEELGKVLLTCLRALCQTGYDANRKELNALWMSLKSTAPKRIVLNPLEHSWAQMLQDSEDSFAVAVVVKKYLGIPSTENEPQSCKQEGGRPTLSRLETAIAINHEIRNSALQRSRMFQEDLDTWRTADHMWRAKWDVSNVNHGETFWIASPKARLKTVCPLTRSHLLLKWDVIKRDQVRGLIGLESDGTRSGHWEYTDDEDRPPVRPIPVHIL
ncbi:hypothetical protein MMC07_004617 [Pseudocyphellaria aurata]|nr:hypothetical protein [Pseudocyphellaria aurata]